MKKIALLLALLVAAMPAMAAVTVSCSDQGGGVCKVSYSGADIRAFGLDITVDSGAVIQYVDNNTVSTDYYVAPGSVTIVEGNIVCDIVASSSYAGTKLGEGTGEMTVEMGSLYEGASTIPSSGDLFSFVVDKSCTVTIKLNEIRAGIVMEDPEADPGIVYESGDTLCTCALDVSEACWGDVTGDLDGMELDTDTWELTYTGNFDAPNGTRNLTDFGALANVLVYEGGTGYSLATYPARAQFDLTGDLDGMELNTDTWELEWTGNFDAPNGVINLTDFGALANLLVYEGGSGYSSPCP